MDYLQDKISKLPLKRNHEIMACLTTLEKGSYYPFTTFFKTYINDSDSVFIPEEIRNKFPKANLKEFIEPFNPYCGYRENSPKMSGLYIDVFCVDSKLFEKIVEFSKTTESTTFIKEIDKTSFFKNTITGLKILVKEGMPTQNFHFNEIYKFTENKGIEFFKEKYPEEFQKIIINSGYKCLSCIEELIEGHYDHEYKVENYILKEYLENKESIESSKDFIYFAKELAYLGLDFSPNLPILPDYKEDITKVISRFILEN